ncbi:dsRBD fold-containing protein [Streptomyces sp. NPDC002666]
MTRPNRTMTMTDEIKVVVLADDDRTQAEVMAKRPFGYASVGVGEARRRPGDPRDAELGEMLALSRAFKAAHRTMTKLIAEAYPNGA